MSFTKAYKNLNYKKGDFPNSEHLAKAALVYQFIPNLKMIVLPK